jgi:hypothetical protein
MATLSVICKHEEFIIAHQLYLSLDKEASSRNKAYRGLFAEHMTDHHAVEMRAAWKTSTPLTNDRFKVRIEKSSNTKGVMQAGVGLKRKIGSNLFLVLISRQRFVVNSTNATGVIAIQKDVRLTL